MPTLLASDLVKRYGGRTVVSGVTLTVEKGEVIGLLGRNGAGKSTTFKMVMGIVKPDRGRIELEAEDITSKPLFRRARAGLGYLAQEPTIFSRLTVEENLQAILETTRDNLETRQSRLEDLLAEFGLEKVRRNKAGMCSGGERRRLEIARTLVTRPKIVLLDEPFAGVDPIAREEITELVRGLAGRGIGVLLTDHNVESVLPITTRSYILIDGRVLKEGSPEEIAGDSDVRREYLGDKFVLQR